jgi:hypothetical protein
MDAGNARNPESLDLCMIGIGGTEILEIEGLICGIEL